MSVAFFVCRRSSTESLSQEIVVAAKVQAIVALGRANSRMTDFSDLLALSRLFEFEGRSLTQAIRAIFERRDTLLPTANPLGLSTAFAEDGDKPRQRSAFVGRELLLLRTVDFLRRDHRVAEFVCPPLQASAAAREEFGRHWPAGGPWT